MKFTGQIYWYIPFKFRKLYWLKLPTSTFFLKKSTTYSLLFWHRIVLVFLKICTDLQEICSIRVQNCLCYCFWTNSGAQLAKLFRNNNKNNFASKCCKFLANLFKSSEILEQCHVKWWLNYRIYGSVSYSFSCMYGTRTKKVIPKAFVRW